MVDGEGRRQLHGDIATHGSGTPSGGKRQLIRGEGSIVRISNILRPQDPGGGARLTGRLTGQTGACCQWTWIAPGVVRKDRIVFLLLGDLFNDRRLDRTTPGGLTFACLDSADGIVDLAGDAAVGAVSSVVAGVASSAVADVTSSAIAEVASSAIADVASLAVAEVASSPLLRWRPRPSRR